VGQTPDNWIFKIDSQYFKGVQVKALVPISDSSIFVFCRTGIYAITDVDHPPVRVSQMDISMPVDVNRDKVVAYSMANTVYFCTLSDLGRDTFSQRYVLTTGDLPICSELNRQNPVVITTIKFDHKENYLWVGTREHGLLKLGLPDFRSGNWARTRNHYLMCSDRRENGIEDFVSNKIQSVFIDKKNRKWVVFDRGLGIIDSMKFHKVFDNYVVQYISESFQGKEHAIWSVVTGSKLKGNQLLMLTSTEVKDIQNQVKAPIPLVEFKNDRISDLLVDHDGDIWGITTSTLFRKKGLGLALSIQDVKDKIDTNLAQYFSYSEGLVSAPLCIEEDLRGIIWIGTESDGLYYLKKSPGLERVFEDSVHCHGEKNAKLRITAVEAKFPCWLEWTSSRHGKGVVTSFRDTVFRDIGLDTFHFKLHDLNGDVGTMTVVVDDPKPLTAKIRKDKIPTYEEYTDGVVELVNIKGGRPYYGHDHWYHGYKVAIDDTTKLGRTLTPLGVRKFTTHVADRRGCLFSIQDSFPRPEHYFKLDSICEKNTDQEHRSKFLTFDAFKFSLRPDAMPVLDELAAHLYKCAKLHLKITGYVYVDAKGYFDVEKVGMNAMDFSQKRANAARDYLLKKGIDKNRLTTVGGGKGEGKMVVFKFTY
jgi:hypothetical protein